MNLIYHQNGRSWDVTREGKPIGTIRTNTSDTATTFDAVTHIDNVHAFIGTFPNVVDAANCIYELREAITLAPPYVCPECRWQNGSHDLNCPNWDA